MPKRHRRPSDVNGPAIGDGELDDACHRQQRQRREACSEAKNEKIGARTSTANLTLKAMSSGPEKNMDLRAGAV